jgi:hypothetical protein
MKSQIIKALSGADIVADALIFGLHDLTQLAALLRSNAKLTVLNSDFLSPLEKSCIATAKPGHVNFQTGRREIR